MHTFIALTDVVPAPRRRLRRPAALVPRQHWRRDQDPRDMVFALVLLFFANHQPIGVIFDTSRDPDRPSTATCWRRSRSACSCRFSSCTASTLLARSASHRRWPPGAARHHHLVLARPWSGSSSCWRCCSRCRAVPPVHRGRPRRRLPDRNDHHRQPDDGDRRRDHLRRLYLLVILASVFVCTLAIQGAATRMIASRWVTTDSCRSAAPGATSTPSSRRRRTPRSRSGEVAGCRADPGDQYLWRLRHCKSPRPG